MTIYALLFAATVSACLLAVRGRQLALHVARLSLHSRSVEGSLELVLRGHHDLRTLLSSAALRAGILLKHTRRLALLELREDAEQLWEDVQQLLALVETIKPEAAQVLATPQPVLVAPAIQESVSDARRRFGGVEIEAQCDRDTAVLVSGGPAALKSLVFNLVVNACKGDGLARATRVSVRVSLPEAQGLALLTVTDDGPGFPREQLARLRNELRLGARHDGHGLGFVSKIVVDSGARLFVAPSSPRGSVVGVRFAAGRLTRRSH